MTRQWRVGTVGGKSNEGTRTRVRPQFGLWAMLMTSALRYRPDLSRPSGKVIDGATYSGGDG